jgi:hypothetical protein
LNTFIFIFFTKIYTKKTEKTCTKITYPFVSKDKLREDFIGAWSGTDSLIGNALSLAFAKFPACMGKEPGGGLKHVIGFV